MRKKSLSEDQLKELVEMVREANSGRVVCDAWFECEGWRKSYRQIADGLAFFDYQTEGKRYRGDKFKLCPWCGSPISWDWERLKE